MNDNILANMLTEAEQALCTVLPPVGSASPCAAVETFPLDELDDGAALPTGDERLDLRIELGRTRLRMDEACNLRSGSVIPLDNLAGEPVGVYAGRRRVARGELLVYDGKIAVRLVEVTGL